jgi:quaternary ammonium compound-resistance protein SugE
MLATALEPVWALALKQSEGSSKPGVGAVSLAIATLSLLMLGLAMRQLPVATAYVVWVGLGAVAVGVAGAAFFGESLSPARSLWMSVIVIGVVGLHRTS